MHRAAHEKGDIDSGANVRKETVQRLQRNL
jgi:hypothetical protein